MSDIRAHTPLSIQLTIIKGIKEQLFFNDYLVLPGFGGFVLKGRPAHFSAAGGLLLPPAKTVSFNSQLKQNDGVLTQWLQTKLNCSANEALKQLTDFSEFCSSVLNTKRRLTLEDIGFFYLDFENNICFEPKADTNFLNHSFGLQPLSVKPLEVIKEERKEPVFIDRSTPTQAEQEKRVTPETRKTYRRFVTPAVLSLFLLLFLTVLLSNRKITGQLQSSIYSGDGPGSYTPFIYEDLKLAVAYNKYNTYVADANGVAVIKLDENKSIAVKVFATNNDLSITENGQFEIVLGCFSIADNANRLATKLNNKKLKAVVSGINQKGMYVVSNGFFADKEVASQRLNQIRRVYPHAWIKKHY